MRNSIAFALFALLFFPSIAQASQCENPEVKREDPYQYVRAVILSLSEAEPAMAPAQHDSSGDIVSRAANSIYLLKEKANGFFCAASILQGYTTSENTGIRETAIEGRKAYLTLLNLNNQLLDGIQQSLRQLDGQSSRAPSTAQLVDNQVKMMDAAKEVLNFSIHSLSTIIASKPEDTEKRLLITQAQRNQLLRLLENEFGQMVRQRIEEQKDNAAGAACAIYRALAADIWKF